MRIRDYVFALFLIAMGCVLLIGACSEQSPEADGDREAPAAVLLHPLQDLPVDIKGTLIQDTATVVVAVTDNDRVVEVQLYILLHGDSVATKVGPALTEADEDGYYTYFWSIGTIDNGSTGVLYAVVTDAAGNQGSSEKMPVQVINSSLLGPPLADFSITPSEGNVETNFSFDPSITRDAIDDDAEILVRWDFDGDGSWEFNLDDSLTAIDVVPWRYARPDTYMVTMQAFNKYYSLVASPPKPGTAIRRLVVLPAEGIADTTVLEMVGIDPGEYALGALRCPNCGLDDDEVLYYYDENGDSLFYADTESMLRVRTSTRFFISKWEITNEEYIAFLNEAQAEGAIYFDTEGDPIVYSADRSQVLLVLDDSLTRVRYAVAGGYFYVDDAYLYHPMTGVSWYGAKAYANHYGMRLPTEVEWEIAARGQILSSVPFYPWEANPTFIDGSYANFRQSGDPFEIGGIPRSTTPVDFYNGEEPLTIDAVSPMGTYGQAGNVAEWTNDWYDADHYHNIFKRFIDRGGEDPVGDPASPTSGTGRAIRGGSHDDLPSVLRVTNRLSAAPTTRSYWIGFRTAYTEF